MKAATPEDARPTTQRNPRLLEGMLLFGYILVLAAAVFTVVIPELGKEPEPGPPSARAMPAPAPK